MRKHAMAIVISGLFMGGVVKGADEMTSRRVEFEVTTSAPLAAGEQVFISGGAPGLGHWRADGLPLTRTDEQHWRGQAVLPAAEPTEFKVTRGTWATEALDPDGRIPANRILAPGADTVVQVQVYDWADHLPPRTPQITGDYRIHEAVTSDYLRLPRTVIVWLPPSYETSGDARYPVLYMHDGQQVFDPQTSTHGQDWEVDEQCTRLIAEGKLQEIIVVASYCTEDRTPEYEPSQRGPQYADFLIKELKPFIDQTYRTRPGREYTAVAGSSMGGAISFYLAWAHPEVFFGAACLSPALAYEKPGLSTRFCLELVEETERPPDLKFYLYCGEGDELERRLLPGMREMEGLLVERGWGEERLRVAVEPEASHSEAAWARHTGEWLRFLFGRP